MSLPELKKFIEDKIEEIDDEQFLNAIKNILEKKSSATFHLTAEQKKAAKEGRKQIEKGNYIDNEKVFSELEKWLNENSLV